MDFMKKSTIALALVAAAGLSTVAVAQDSTSNVLPPASQPQGQSDALDAFSPANQCKAYVVDLTPFTTRGWNTRFGVAPIVKSSKIAIDFENSLIRAQSISRDITDGTPAAEYAVWEGPGFGVNTGDLVNPAPQNDTPNFIDFGGDQARQFALAFQEVGGGSTDGEAIITGIVNIDPDEPRRLYVERVVTATSGTDQFFGNTLADGFGFGSVDSNGNTVFKEGGFGFTFPQSAILVDAKNRDCATVNAIDTLTGTPSTAADAANTVFVADQRGSFLFDDTLTAPNVVAESAGGPALITSSFGGDYLNGDFGGTTVSPLAAPFGLGTRGSFATSNDLAVDGVGGTSSIAILTKDTIVDVTRAFTFWNVDGQGNRLPAASPQNLYIEFPPTLNDNKYPRPAPMNVFFEHYRSQVAAQGGTSQITFNRDRDGDLVAAAYISDVEEELNDLESGIAAVRRDAAGNNQFGLVAWTGERNSAFDAIGVRGKPVVDGPGGNVIGFLSNMSTFTLGFGGQPDDQPLSFGPSISAPSIDDAGNIWFLAPVELLETPVANPADAPAIDPLTADIEIGLVRAVYDESAAQPAWDLEVVLRGDDVFTGQNSTVDYRVGLGFFTIAESPNTADGSVSTATFWSHNAIQSPYAGVTNDFDSSADPRNTGGVIVNAEVIYDLGPTDPNDPDDPTFDFNSNDAGVADEGYNTILYVGADFDAAACVPCTNVNGVGIVDGQDLVELLGQFGNTGNPGDFSGDVNCSGTVDGQDLVALLGDFGTDPGC
jgi:hypothetical protein